MKKNIRIFLSFFATFCCCVSAFCAGGKYELRQGKTSLTVDTVKGTVDISLDGTAKRFTKRGDLWNFRIFDADTAKRNTNPAKEKRLTYWGNTWKPSAKIVTSSQAELVSVDKKADSLTLKYRHALAEVSVCYEIRNNSVSYCGTIKNLGKEPVCDFSVMPGLAFSLGNGETILAPDQSCQGAEYSHVFEFTWSLTSAWNGFLIREPAGRGVIAVDNVQEIEKEYLMSGSSLEGDKSGKNLRYTNNMRLFAKNGEERKSSRIVLRHFKHLRHWADAYIKLNFPKGLKTLRQKLGEERFKKLSRAYLAPTYGSIAQAGNFIKHAPGQYIVHPPAWMKPVPGYKSNWDAFPNYFPPAREAGTMAELASFIRSVKASGQFFMPRNSFFYWTIGSDFDKKHNLAANAMVCEDGKPRSAKWDIPGYLVSPSAKPVLAELDRIYNTWDGMGANLYFTNVIAAIDPYNNRYDFHKDSPAPDQMYTMISRLMKRHGDKKPLFSEGGGFWQFPWQVGICEKPGWDKKKPLDHARSNPKRVTVVRAAQEVPLYLGREFVQLYPTNTSYADGPYSAQRISYSMVNGIGLKCGFFTGVEPNRKNLLLLRTIALLAEKVQSRLYGSRLLDYRVNADSVVTANYSGNKVIYNPSAKTVPFRCAFFKGEIAVDGFGFNAADGKTAAGIFASVNGQQFDEPLWLVVEKGAEKGTVRIYTPFTENSHTFIISSKKVTTPAYKAVLDKKVPGVTLLLPGGKVIADAHLQGVNLYKHQLRMTGSNKPFKVPAYAGSIPLKLDWQQGQPLPELLKKFQNCLNSDGLRMPPSAEPHVIESPELVFGKDFYVEAVFRFNREVEEPIRFGEINVLRAEAKDNSIYKRTIELRYHLFLDSLRSLAAGPGYKYSGLDDRKFSWKPGQYYHVIFKFDGKTQTLTINGVEAAKGRIPGNALEKNMPVWRLGDLTADITFQLIRIGGTR